MKEQGPVFAFHEPGAFFVHCLSMNSNRETGVTISSQTSFSASASFAPPVDIPVVRPPFGAPNLPNALFITIGTPSGIPHIVQVDTGSTGIVIPAFLLAKGGDLDNGLADGVICLGPAQISYYPSQDTLDGCYYYVPGIQLGLLPDKSSYACGTGPSIVFGAQYAGTVSDPRRNPVGAGMGMGMMGIGFGRPSLGFVANAGTATPIVYRPTNPFLAAAQSSAPLYPSYRLSSRGDGVTGHITLGLTNGQFLAESPDARLTQLPKGTAAVPANVPDTCGCNGPATGGWPAPPKELPYWTGIPAAITIDTLNGNQPLTATMLLDTGVDLMMMSIPGIANWPLGLANATVGIAVPDASAPIMQYGFTLDPPSVTCGIASGSPAAPSQFLALAALTPPPPSPSPLPSPSTPSSGTAGTEPAFVNTGIDVLLAYDYYFDGLNGQVGFAPNTVPPSSRS